MIKKLTANSIDVVIDRLEEGAITEILIYRKPKGGYNISYKLSKSKKEYEPEIYRQLVLALREVKERFEKKDYTSLSLDFVIGKPLKFRIT